jgi:hypothetical protein
VATLLKISRALSANSGYFSGPGRREESRRRPRNERKVFRRIHEDPDRWVLLRILAYPADKHMEPFHVTFEVKNKEDLIFFNHKERNSSMSWKDAGFNYENETYALGTGDNLYFVPASPAFRAVGREGGHRNRRIYASE